MFWDGIFGFILYSFCLAIFCIFKLSTNGIQYPDNLIQYFYEFDYNDFILCISIIIFHFIFNISLILTCNYFTPIHILIISIIKETYSIFQTGSNLALNILGFFILILIFITFLVFIEVIEINICKLSYNTKGNIELRSKTDSLVEYDYINFPEDELDLNEVGDLDSLSSISIYY